MYAVSGEGAVTQKKRRETAQLLPADINYAMLCIVRIAQNLPELPFEQHPQAKTTAGAMTQQTVFTIKL
jgi:hypothetical protein